MHYRADAGLQKIIRLTREAEAEVQPSEPIKLLEVNEHTVPAGVMPINFGPDPAGGIPYPSVIVELTPEEFARIQSDALKLPQGWLLGEELPKPADDRNGQRPENCESPWEDAGQVLHSPLDWSFIPQQLLRSPQGLQFIRLLHLSIERAVQEFQ